MSKKEYSRVLLSCATQRHLVFACPLAFGEVGVKERVKSVLNYKKPALWISISAILVCAVIAVCFLTNPSREYEIRITIPAGSMEAFCYSDEEICPKGNTLTLAIRVPIKKAIILLWGSFIVLPVVALAAMYFLDLLRTYQAARIEAFFTQTGEEFYLTNLLRTFSENIALFGNSGNDVIAMLPDVNSDYIFSYIINSYGSMAGMLVVGILVVLVGFVFSAAWKQKNEMGTVMGIGCGMVLLLNIGLNLFGSLGWIPPASSFLPFFSVGRSNVVLCYALVGFVMSIYRYKEVYPRHVNTTQVEFEKKLTIKISL